MANPNVQIVIPGDFPLQIQGSAHLKRLKKHGKVVLYTDLPLSADDKIHRVKDATCILNSRGAVSWPGDVLRQLPKLKMITACGIGTDSLDLETAKELGIVVCNVPGKTALIVAEHALALLFAVAKRAWFHTHELKKGRWTRMDNVYLRGKTIGILGAGSIGAATIQLCKAVGMNVIAWTLNPMPERAAELGVPFVSLEELLQQSDAISIHLKLTDRSRGLIGEREFKLMKPGAFLINTARGAIVDTNALVGALQYGSLGGAGLDVFDQEPLPGDHPLLNCAQIVLTPHVADQNPEGTEILNAGAVDNVIAFFEGKPQNRVA